MALDEERKRSVANVDAVKDAGEDVILSKLAQTNYATILTDVNLQAGKRISPESALFGMPSVKRWTDNALAMKGFNYSTQVDEIERDLTESLVLTGDSWLLPWAFAMAMGTSVASQPDISGSPLAYQHVIKPQDPVANGKSAGDHDLRRGERDAQYAAPAAIHGSEAGHAGCSRKGAPLKLTVDLVGSGQVTTGLLASQPSLYTLVPLFSQNLVFKYGPVGATTDISSTIVDGSVKLTFSWDSTTRIRAPSGASIARVPGSPSRRSRWRSSASWMMRTPRRTMTFSRMPFASACSACKARRSRATARNTIPSRWT